MSKKFSAVIAVVSSILSNSASFAGLDCRSCHDYDIKDSKDKEAAFHYTISKPNTDEARWWNEYETSTQRDITRYVENLASKDPKAATWFLLTGGKYGFSKNLANEEETALLLSAMKKVAQFFGSAPDRTEGLQEWSKSSLSSQKGHLHLQMIYKELDQLKEINKILNSRVNSVEKELQETNNRLQQTNNRLQESERRLRESELRLEESERRWQEAEKRLQQSEQRAIEISESINQERMERVNEVERLVKMVTDPIKAFEEERKKQSQAFEEKCERSLGDYKVAFNKILSATNESCNMRISAIESSFDKLRKESDEKSEKIRKESDEKHEKLVSRLEERHQENLSKFMDLIKTLALKPAA